jgi:hypothetical protein
MLFPDYPPLLVLVPVPAPNRVGGAMQAGAITNNCLGLQHIVILLK